MTSRDTGLVSALAVLSADLDDANIDLKQSFDLLTAVFRAAIPSYCGMTIVMVADGMPVTITAPDVRNESSTVAASLVIPLSTISPTAQGELVVFASVAGAFVDLAADLAYETATELIAFAVDTRLGPALDHPVGVGGFSVIHQAIGVLVESGCTPEQARDRIKQIAADDGRDLVAAAERVVKGADR